MLLVCVLTATTARAQETKQDGNWTYKDYGTYALISAYTGSDKTTLNTLNFPKLLGGLPVMGIAWNFYFSEFTNLQTLNFYRNAHIDEMPSVMNCSKLAHINIIQDNGTIETADGLTNNIVTIPGNCFRGTAIENIFMPRVTSVGSGIFRDSNSLRSVTFDRSASIEDGAFSYIQSSCTIDYAFWLWDWTWQKIAYSPNLYVNCPDGAIGWCGDGGDSAQDFLYWTMDASRNLTIACAGDGWFNFQDKQIIKSHRWNDYVASISKTVTSITLSQVYALGANEFKGMTGVTWVTLNDGLTSIGASAFEGCTKLTSITIPASVTSIGADAFKGCTFLTTVTIEGNPTIAEGAFPSGVTVNLPSATAPTITTQPTSLNLTEGYESGNVLTVAASTVEGQTLSYQWYSNTDNSTTGGTAIDDATSANYTIPTGKTAGTYYYYCIVTATMNPNGQTATTTSDVATVTIASAEPPAPTTYAITTDGNCEVYYTEGWDEVIVTEAEEGKELAIRIKDGVQPEAGKYFTEEFTVNGTSLGFYESSYPVCEFTMPAEAVTVAAVQANQMTLTYDFTTAGPQEMPGAAVILFNNDERVNNSYVEEGDYNAYDFDNSGTPDMKLYFDTSGDHVYVEPLAGADAKGIFSFTYSGSMDPYSTIRFFFPTVTTAGGTTITTTIGGGYTVSVDDVSKTGGVIGLTDGTGVSLTYSRTLSAPSGTGDKTIDGQPAKLYTTCLPYTPTTGMGIKYYTLSGTSGSTLLFDEESSPAAETPYLVAVFSGSFDEGKTGTDVTLKKVVTASSSAGGYTLRGTLMGLTNSEATGKYILQPGGVWQKVASGNESVYVPPFRAYIEGTASGARLLGSALDGETTGIDSIRTTDSDGTERWYDLNGRRIDKPNRKGLYIHNGKVTTTNYTN